MKRGLFKNNIYENKQNLSKIYLESLQGDKLLQVYLRETKFCDFFHPDIKKISSQIVNSYDDIRTKAVKFFEWVRDNILFRIGEWNKKASETLKERMGACTNKANLLVAFLRLNNIPAGYGIMRVRGQRYWGPIGLSSLAQFASEISVHIYCVVYLNNKWIKCDPSDDQMFSKNTYYLNPQSKLVEWDGIHDALLNLDKKDILEDIFPVDNIDFLMLKRARLTKKIPIKVANFYIDFLRKTPKRFLNLEECEIDFKKWLKRNHPFYYYLFFSLITRLVKGGGRKIDPENEKVFKK